MKIRNIILVIIAFIAVGFIFFRFSQSNSVAVKKVEVIKGDVIKSISTSGFVKSNLETDVGFPVSGRVTHVYFKEGDQVKQGDLIAQVYSEDLFFSAESARKSKDAIQRTRDIYTQNYQNDRDAVGGDKEYELNIEKLTDDLRAADNSYKASLSNLQKTYLYAPISGTLTNFDLKVGNVVSVADVFKISDLNQLEIQADLDQEDYTDLKAGQEVEIILDSYPDQKFKGEVINKPLFVDEDSTTRTFKVRIRIDNIDGKVVKGMTGDANIITDKALSVNYLPFDAIYTEESKGSGEIGTIFSKYVWVVSDNNKIKKEYIETGLEGDTLTEIKSELLTEVILPIASSVKVNEGQSAKFE